MLLTYKINSALISSSLTFIPLAYSHIAFQGAGSVPQSVQLQKQQALLEQLTRKLNLQVDDHDIAHASVDDLKNKVDDAVAEVCSLSLIKSFGSCFKKEVGRIVLFLML